MVDFPERYTQARRQLGELVQPTPRTTTTANVLERMGLPS